MPSAPPHHDVSSHSETAEGRKAYWQIRWESLFWVWQCRDDWASPSKVLLHLRRMTVAVCTRANSVRRWIEVARIVADWFRIINLASYGIVVATPREVWMGWGGPLLHSLTGLIWSTSVHCRSGFGNGMIWTGYTERSWDTSKMGIGSMATMLLRNIYLEIDGDY